MQIRVLQVGSFEVSGFEAGVVKVGFGEVHAFELQLLKSSTPPFRIADGDEIQKGARSLSRRRVFMTQQPELMLDAESIATCSILVHEAVLPDEQTQERDRQRRQHKRKKPLKPTPRCHTPFQFFDACL